MKKIVVIGASAASISFMTKIRAVDKSSQIICISKEPDFPYNRCFLADVFQGEKTESEIVLKPRDWYSTNHIDLQLGVTVVAIDQYKKFVQLDSGESVSYDALFLGIGARAAQPPIMGLDTPGVFSFYTLADMNALAAYVQTIANPHVTVIGGGINGIEAASALHELGCRVRIVELQESIMPLQLTQDLSAIVAGRAMHHDIQILCNTAVQKVIAEHGRVAGVLADGVELATDIVVVATGARKNIELLEDLDLVMHNGSVVVNRQLQTSDPSMFAGGDIIAAPDIVSGELVSSAAWADAMLQGLCAGTQFTKRPRQYPGVINARDSWFFGKDYYACGDTTSGTWDEVKDIPCKDSHSFERLYISQGKLAGFVIYGDLARVGTYKKWYMKQEDVDSVDFV